MSITTRHSQSAEFHPSLVRTQTRETDSRSVVEGFVSASFRQHYGAQVQQFLPTLMSLSNEFGRLEAVVGFRHADHNPLFLEHYLEQPIEQVLADKLKTPIDRSRLVEVGNLAVSKAGGGRWLILALTAYLSAAGSEWALFTMGPLLYNSFTRLGLELVEIAEARLDALPVEERRHWGSYYDQKPRVLAGNVAQAHAVLWSLCQHERALRELWINAQQAGRAA